MEPYYEKDGISIYCGDSFDVLPRLGPFDLCITDPPYTAKTHANAKTNKGAGHGVKLIDFGSLSDCAFIALVDALLVSVSGWVVMTCDHFHAAQILARSEFVRLGAWVKPNPMPQISADRPGQGHEAVAILHGGKVPKSWNRGGGAAIWTHQPEHDGVVPTQKPLSLIKDFLSDFAQPGQSLVDPFMGAGTTLLAARDYGVNAVGIEANESRCEIAVRRLAQKTLF